MEYKLNAGQKDIYATVEIGEDGGLNIVMDKNSYAVKYAVVSDNRIHMEVTLNSRTKQVTAFVADCADGKAVGINGRCYLIKDLETNANRVKTGVTPNIPEQITPPMPAVVARIPVQVGDQVKKGQSVIVVTAMKMETTLSAPYDGTVVKIHVAVNDKVSPGQILMEIEKEGVAEQ